MYTLEGTIPRVTANSTQLRLPFSLTEDNTSSAMHKTRTKGQANKLDKEDRAVHDWYRFVLSFPPHLVRDYISDFGLKETHTLLDPFCGTGTTLVEAKLLGIGSIGLEANLFAHFASTVKVDWEVNPDDLQAHAHEIAASVLQRLKAQGIDDDLPFDASQVEIPLMKLGSEAAELLITNSISPLPLHKSLLLLDCIRQHHAARCYQHLLLAYANALVFKVSNLHFGPEVGAGKPKEDTPVVSAWLAEVERMTGDLLLLAEGKPGPAKVFLADARQLSTVVPPNSVDAIITSPPYPNEKDYTRTTRLELVILGFIKNKADLKLLKQNLIRSNTRGVYKADQDDQWVAENPEIQRISAQIEQRRVELGKDSGV